MVDVGHISAKNITCWIAFVGRHVGTLSK